MGGMQLLQFCTNFPNRTFSAIPIACGTSHSAQNIALNELARQAIMADPVWDNGKYLKKKLNLKMGWLLQEWWVILVIYQKKECKKNSEENYRKKLIMNLVLMQIFKSKVT